MAQYDAVAENETATDRESQTQHDLDEIVERHRRFLAHEKNGVWASFKLMDLSYLDLSDRDLRGADFTGADMNNKRLTGANLTDAIMFAFDLRQANLSRAAMHRVDLRGSSLVEADLRAGRLYNRDSHGEYQTARDKQ